MKSTQNLFILFLLVFVPFIACDNSTSPSGGEITTVADTLADIPASVETIIRTSGPVADLPGDTAGTSTYTFFDLETGEIVADSLSDAWDIAFSSTTIIANSGNGGGIQVVDEAYSEVLQAPTEGYTSSTSDAAVAWYTYNPQTHSISANANTTIFVLTPDGQYAKVEMDSYYNSETQAPRYFTFYYTLQTSGSTSLSNVVYYDIDSQTIVEDAASSQWDIAFGATTIYANSENGGGIVALNTDFAELVEAPETGYQAQNASWYTYTGNTPPMHAILPIEGVTLVFQTPDGNYGKFKVLSYYKGNPDTTTDDFANFIRPASRYYTIQFAFQTDGTRFFED
jgi:hypothetical protein